MPSTHWKEVIPDGEEARFSQYAEQLRGMQKRNASGRALHAKPTGAFAAKLEILPDLPEHARHGVFARAATYDAYARFSNGAGKRQSDRKGDVRGLAIKVLGIDGKKVLGDGRTQDFLAIHTPQMVFRTVDEFVTVVLAAQSPATAIFRLFGALGVGRTFEVLKRLASSTGTPIATLAGMRYFSVLPVCVGPYAARFAFEPRQALEATPGTRNEGYLTSDLESRLREGSVEWEMKLQFFENDGQTPIEDPTVDWSSPYITVARLTLPKQDASSAEGKQLAERIDAMSFDPWHALVEHRPLGAMMRARKHAYFASTQERGATPEPS